MQIDIKNAIYTYGRSPQPALKSISLEADYGEFVALIGASGSGKSTLCRLILGLLSPSEGEVRINGAHKEEGQLFAGVGMVFQYPEQQLFAETVYEEVAFALKCHGVPEAKHREAVEEALLDVGLDHRSFCERNPFMLSGGEKRRVAIASVLVMQPQLLILDEPSAGVDLQGRRFITELAKRKNAEGVTVLWVTHNMEEAAELASRVVVLQNGSVLLNGTPEQVFNNRQAEALGLELPPAARLIHLLKQADAPIEGRAVRFNAAIEEIAAWKQGGEPSLE